jgi:hypothetical protein
MGKSLSHIRSGFALRLIVVVALGIVLLQATACGRKPGDVDPPPGAVSYPYPPLDGK